MFHHDHDHDHDDHHHLVILLLVENRAPMKSFQALRSPAIPLTSFHDLPVFLISSSIVLRHVLFGLPLLLLYQEQTTFEMVCDLVIFLSVIGLDYCQFNITSNRAVEISVS